jgi:hypothetical protein
MLVKVPSKETEAVVAALSEHVRKLPAKLRLSLTWDRGLKMAKHKESLLRRMCKFISAIRKVPGTADRMKIRTCSCGNTSREARTCRPFLKRSSTRSRCA